MPARLESADGLAPASPRASGARTSFGRRVRFHLLCALVLGLAGCGVFGGGYRHPGVAEGTCGGACAHYVDCKDQSRNDRLFHACLGECEGVFDREDSLSLAAYERLECTDAVSFIEGDSGREPGQTTVLRN